jgi:hypothetical protein
MLAGTSSLNPKAIAARIVILVSGVLAALAFWQKWGQQIPVIGQAWRSAWEHVTPFMSFEPEVL